MSARILVIEDNSANLELMVYLLHAYGHITVAVSDGEQGLQVMGQVKPDLIICDIQLPKIDGYEVVRRLKAEPAFRFIPTIAVTALAMVGDRERILAAGFDGYIAKPIDPEMFVQQVEAFLSSGAGSRRPPEAAQQGRPSIRQTSTLGKILVLDNVGVNLDLARGILEPVGYEVWTATTAIDALAMAYERNPDLILSDICMPSENGFDFIKKVKASPSLSRIPFIFITSSMLEREDRLRGLALGADKFLVRPIEPGELIAEIGSCLSA